MQASMGTERSDHWRPRNGSRHARRDKRSGCARRPSPMPPPRDVSSVAFDVQTSFSQVRHRRCYADAFGRGSVSDLPCIVNTYRTWPKGNMIPGGATMVVVAGLGYPIRYADGAEQPAEAVTRPRSGRGPASPSQVPGGVKSVPERKDFTRPRGGHSPKTALATRLPR